MTLTLALSSYVDNRELSLAIWIVAATVASMLSPSLRRSLLGVFRSLFCSIIAWYLLLLVTSTVLLVWLASELGVWDRSLIGEVLIWFFGTAIVSFVNLGQEVRTPHLARRLALRSVSAAVLLDFFVNLHPFSLGVELVLIPVLVFVGALAAFAESSQENARFATWMNRFMSVFGLVAILYVGQWMILDFSTIDWDSIGRTFATPIWLTLGSIPIFLTFRWFIAFGEFSSAVRMEAWRIVQSGVVDETPNKLRAKLAVIMRSRLEVEPMLDWEKNRQALRALVLADSRREADEIVRAELNRREESEAANEQRS